MIFPCGKTGQLVSTYDHDVRVYLHSSVELAVCEASQPANTSATRFPGLTTPVLWRNLPGRQVSFICRPSVPHQGYLTLPVRTRCQRALAWQQRQERVSSTSCRNFGPPPQMREYLRHRSEGTPRMPASTAGIAPPAVEDVSSATRSKSLDIPGSSG